MGPNFSRGIDLRVRSTSTFTNPKEEHMIFTTIILDGVEFERLTIFGGMEDVLQFGRSYAAQGHVIRIERFHSGTGLYENGE